MDDVSANPPRVTEDVREEPVAAPASPESLALEVARIPRDQVLVESGEFVVFVTEAEPIPHLLYEIGRLREETFRSVGEGTGKALDLDEFDAHYHHLILWNRARGEVAGAYRCGATDRILPRFGPDGLYTSSLFTYRMELLARLTPALELGRAFVRLDYQRSYSPLMLLWRGIGQWVVRNPRYRLLFGSVSIRGDLPAEARRWIVRHLIEHAFLPGFARFVRAHHPVHEERLLRVGSEPRFDEMAELEQAVSTLIGERGGVPVLLKQYLKLGGRAFAFGRDPGFHDTLDVLTLVDLAAAPHAVLERYIGKNELPGFLEVHRCSSRGRWIQEAAA